MRCATGKHFSFVKRYVSIVLLKTFNEDFEKVSFYTLYFILLKFHPQKWHCNISQRGTNLLSQTPPIAEESRECKFVWVQGMQVMKSINFIYHEFTFTHSFSVQDDSGVRSVSSWFHFSFRTLYLQTYNRGNHPKDF